MSQETEVDRGYNHVTVRGHFVRILEQKNNLVVFVIGLRNTKGVQQFKITTFRPYAVSHLREGEEVIVMGRLTSWVSEKGAIFMGVMAELIIKVPSTKSLGAPPETPFNPGSLPVKEPSIMDDDEIPF